MSEAQPQQSDPLKQANLLFYEKAKKSFQHLFELAKAKNELHFAFSLSPEFRVYKVLVGILHKRLMLHLMNT